MGGKEFKPIFRSANPVRSIWMRLRCKQRVQLIVLIVCSLLNWMYDYEDLIDWFRRDINVESISNEPKQLQQEERCAILLYGLPRNFKAFVLPSLIENVIIPNAAYHCDYYLHHYVLKHEPAGRWGAGGAIDPNEVYLLESAVMDIASRQPNKQQQQEQQRVPTIAFVNNTDAEFRERYRDLLHQIATAKDAKGELIYFPLSDPSMQLSSVENIVKMWYGQELVWNLTVQHADRLNVKYTRMAVLRNDVFFVTPIDIWKRRNGKRDKTNRHAVIPDFCNYPVNDRLMYGPAGAIQIWASERFSRLDEHMERVRGRRIGIHSEKFLYYNIFPAIRRAGYAIEKDRLLCFCRSRSDDIISTKDCWAGYKSDFERIIGRNCTTVPYPTLSRLFFHFLKLKFSRMTNLYCPPSNNDKGTTLKNRTNE